MGFECCFFRVPIVDPTLTPAQTLAMYLYADYEHNLADDWHQTQIANGYTFDFDAAGGAAKECLVSADDVLNAYMRIFEQSGAQDPGLLEYWCSIGRRFHKTILEYATPVFPGKNSSEDYYYLTKITLKSALFLR